MDLGIQIFETNDELLLKFVLENSPWIIKGHCLALKRWEKDMQLDKVDFFIMPFWVQIYNLLVERINEANEFYLGRRIENPTKVDVVPFYNNHAM